MANDKWKDCVKAEAAEGIYGRGGMTPIEAALAKIRELRKAEKQINREVMFDHLPDCRAAEYRECTCIAVTSAALRNAAEPLLGLLEALLESLSLSDEDYWEYGGIARQKTEAALAAFVEGEDAA